MSIPFRVVERIAQPGQAGGATKFYAQSHTRGVMDIAYLTTRIEQISTVSGADIRAVLYALVDVIPEALGNGQIIEIGELGRFRVSISSNGEATAEEVNRNSIRGSKILFRPGKRLQTLLKTLEFNKENPPPALDGTA